MLEHLLRPLFSFFRAQILPTAVYATAADFENGHLRGEEINRRLRMAVRELGLFLGVIECDPEGCDVNTFGL
ncbi:hypothetical protein RB548_28455 (plasmid) [Sinorhizobium chiapasense]|uniref:Uncharacterized protein n=1 Tax=Sinorhizobium chiapasense TaxID=501572 RepID=A0ABZ2BKV4_9HYPH